METKEIMQKHKNKSLALQSIFIFIYKDEYMNMFYSIYNLTHEISIYNFLALEVKTSI